ncbi:bacteriohemerythrin [Desulfocurvus sp. DL9XJH121]
MPFIEWDERMTVGVEEIDDQHKKLLAIINTLHEACSQGCNPEAVGRAAEELTEYTRYHFTTEERYMTACDYPEQERHLEEHMECNLKALDFFSDHVAEINPKLGKEILVFLKDWLVNHILKTDRRLGRCLGKNLDQTP